MSKIHISNKHIYSSINRLLSISFHYREIKVLQASNENYQKIQQSNINVVDPKLALAEQRLEAMFQELVSVHYELNRSQDSPCKTLSELK